MLPCAARSNVRLVFLNRRDYPGSSPLTPDERARLGSLDVQTRATALRSLGGEIGAFLAWFVRSQGLPPVTTIDGVRVGGIALVAWSLAHLVTCPLLAYPDELPETTRSILHTHLRTYCALCSPAFTFGISTAHLYTPLAEDHISPDERASRFNTWVSAYYTYSAEAIATHDPSLLTDEPLPYPTPPESDFTSANRRPPSVLAMSAADRAQVAWSAAFNTSERLLASVPPEIAFEHTRRALLDRATAARLPECKFVLLWAAQGTAVALAAAWGVERLYSEHEARSGAGTGEVGRRAAIVGLPWANQFPHWDEPERTLEALLSVC